MAQSSMARWNTTTRLPDGTPAIPMRGCSLTLDDEPILIDGQFAVAELCRPGAVPARAGR